MLVIVDVQGGVTTSVSVHGGSVIVVAVPEIVTVFVVAGRVTVVVKTDVPVDPADVVEPAVVVETAVVVVPDSVLDVVVVVGAVVVVLEPPPLQLAHNVVVLVTVKVLFWYGLGFPGCPGLGGFPGCPGFPPPGAVPLG